MKEQTETRDQKGRFAPGTSGNPIGGNKRLTAEQRIERALSAHGPEMLEHAFLRAKEDDAVLTGLLNFLTASQGTANLNAAALLLAGIGVQH
ncbi:hypothetical protein QN386_06915 [Pseudomonas sp. CCI3.2]|uniref:hypothetical protein n=1 Tax=unclassified Pseudomonas TaxID=196821 RepID=UPI002B234FEB|nr:MULTISPECIES: hypothetical protein [unclassified Pseudomonas]MEB0076304.1 hypothetical protein [Pseudomonas sp. MH10out]MEB0101057.1 hypothetical protein [Pseudomonas sp. CCI3.2]MEB0128916.1 hypothetical protein [Pseudomonas sp. CCI2.4]